MFICLVIFVIFVAAVIVATISTDKALTTDNRKEADLPESFREVFTGNIYTGGIYADIAELAENFREAYNPEDLSFEEMEQLIWEGLACQGYNKNDLSREDQDRLWRLAVEAIYDI